METSEERNLTEKERKVIEEFSSYHPDYGVIAERNIRNKDTGWKESIEAMEESEIVLGEPRSKN